MRTLVGKDETWLVLLHAWMWPFPATVLPGHRMFRAIDANGQRRRNHETMRSTLGAVGRPKAPNWNMRGPADQTDAPLHLLIRTGLQVQKLGIDTWSIQIGRFKATFSVG